MSKKTLLGKVQNMQSEQARNAAAARAAARAFEAEHAEPTPAPAICPMQAVAAAAASIANAVTQRQQALGHVVGPAASYIHAKSHDPEPARPAKRVFLENDEMTPEEREERKRRRAERSLPSATETIVNSLPEALQHHHELTNHLKSYDEKAERDTYQDAVNSGGLIEGGTWEHRKRAQEMAITALKAEEATRLQAHRPTNQSGTISYMPQSVLEQFEQRVAQAKAGIVASNGPSGAAIDSSNKGHAMLAKMGWTPGQGLGANNQGISQPIGPSGSTSLGDVGDSCIPQADDDEFDTYRKRMMLAYRFRPNPMNNPRRAYDGYSTLYDASNSSAGLESVAESLLNNQGNRTA